MNVRSLLVILVIALVAALVVVWTQPSQSPQSAEETANPLFVPELEAQFDKLSMVTVMTAGGQTVVTLNRNGEVWTVAEKGDYPADTEVLAELLRGLAEARQVERKTSKPEWYDRLGVEDVGNEEATGVRVDLAGLDAPVGVIVGHTNPGAGRITYLRRSDQSTSWAVDREIEPPREVLSWVEQEILDLDQSRIQSVTVHHPDGETLVVGKETPQAEQFAVEGVPEGRALESEWEAEATASALSELTLDDVLPAADGEADTADRVTAEYRTFEGLLIEAVLEKRDDRNLLRLYARAEPERAVETESEATEGGQPAELAEKDTVAREAERLNERLHPWVFVIGNYAAENISKRMEDVLKPLEEAEDSPAEAAQQ